uniref:Family with sequence similarity 86 member B1 n=1 Tax=Pipistrellus kuhlii TaxID=59472 RepID=A0A7J7YXJ1_PIPKU|nr:family with sequence similarity 86 member B1 [Pipistrellus kuhlii]
MAPEESVEASPLLQSFERRFLAARALRSFPWQPSGDSVTLSESLAIISHGTTGLVTWNAALYLAEWAIENPAAFTHRCAVLPRNCPLTRQGPADTLCLPEGPAGS